MVERLDRIKMLIFVDWIQEFNINIYFINYVVYYTFYHFIYFWDFEIQLINLFTILL